jgi:hypothetical protein
MDFRVLWVGLEAGDDAAAVSEEAGEEGVEAVGTEDDCGTCLLHRKEPLACFVDQVPEVRDELPTRFESIKEYSAYWMPSLVAEAAHGACAAEDSLILPSTPVLWLADPEAPGTLITGYALLSTKGSVVWPQEHDLLCIRRKLKGGGVWIAHARIDSARQITQDEVQEPSWGCSVASVFVAKFTVCSRPINALQWNPPMWSPAQSQPQQFEVVAELWSAACFTVELLPITLPDRLQINCVQQLPPSRPVACLLGLPGATEDSSLGPALSLEAVCKGSAVFERVLLNLNDFQQEAIRRAMRGDPVVNIWGVPGSGKTKTASAMIRLFVRAQQLTTTGGAGRGREGQADWGWGGEGGEGDADDGGGSEESDDAAGVKDEMEGGESSEVAEGDSVVPEHYGVNVIVFAGPSNKAVDVMVRARCDFLLY